MKKKFVKSIVALFVGAILCTACGSNSNSHAKTCDICGKTLTEETGSRKVTTTNGKKATVCNQCYVVGKQYGKIQ